MHMQSNFDDFDLKKFEDAELARLGMPQGIVMRHRPTHFQHLFSGSHYAAGYYVYVLMLGYVMAISLCHGCIGEPMPVFFYRILQYTISLA